MAERGIRIQLCGQFAVSEAGDQPGDRLRGRQVRMLFGFLVLNRTRSVGRDELVEAVWPYGPPSAPGIGLRALLSNLRAGIGSSRVIGTSDLRLALPPNAWIDVEAAEQAIHLAESTAAQGDWHRAYGPAHVARYISARVLLTGLEAPWIEERRRELTAIHVRALECCAAVLLGIGNAELPIAERTARELVKAEPLRETGYRLLMEILAAREDSAGALRVYEDLRCRLRDELGTFPGPATQAVHRRLLGEPLIHRRPEAPPSAARPPRPAPPR